MQTHVSVVRNNRVKAGYIGRIYFLGDLHIGVKACHKKLIREMVREIEATEGAMVVLMGDIIDAVSAKDKRYRADNLDPDLGQAGGKTLINNQIKMAIDLLKPLEGKVLNVLIGNHEETLIDVAEFDPLEPIADALFPRIPYERAYCSYTRLQWMEKLSTRGQKYWTVNLVCHHGTGGGLFIGAKANRLERRAGYFPSADILASGHVHARLHDPNMTTLDLEPMRQSDRPDLTEHVAHGFLTGSALKGYDTGGHGSLYTERKDFPPCALGGMYADYKLGNTHGNTTVKINGGCYPW